MKLASVEAIASALEGAGVRYLVVGGLAVAAHGYERFTKDIDLVIQLVPDNVIAAFDALAAIGYKPHAPVSGQQFAQAALRERWIKDKGLVVLQLWSDAHRETPIDVFVKEPFDFESEVKNGDSYLLPSGTVLPVVSRATLLKMKQEAGRPKDLIDIDELQRYDFQQREC